EQLTRLLDDLLGWPSQIMRRLGQTGHDIRLIPANAKLLQTAWAAERGLALPDDWRFSLPALQISEFKPDVLWIGSCFEYFGAYLQALREHCRRVVTWIACPTPANLSLAGIDCVLTSHAN